MVGDLRGQLTAICHRELRLGEANQESLYFKGIQAALPDTLKDVSNSWRSAPGIPRGARRIAMAYHGGTRTVEAGRPRGEAT